MGRMGQKIGHPQGWRTETASKSVVIVHPDTAQGRRSPKPKPRGWRIPSFEMERILEDPGSGACSIGDIGGTPESSFSPLIPISAGKPAAASTALGPRPKGLVSFQEKVCKPSGTVGTFKRKKWMEHDGNLCAKHLGAYLIFPSWSRYLFQHQIWYA